jgi:hypothetical protein
MLFNICTTQSAISVKTSAQSPRLATVQKTIKEAFGRICQGHDYPYASGALWSTHDILEYILAQIGPADLTLCTWSVSIAAAEKLLQWKNAGTLRSVKMLVDWRVQVRTPGMMELAKKNSVDMRVSSCHAKAFILQNAEWSISMVGSANLTNNPRIECGHISTSEQVCNFHKAWILAEIENAKPFGIDMRRCKPDGRK